ncbi:MAG: phytanoyl-CoA dioxygenase family protein [Planctomycetes bacterium]|nr:phytanoyl-CoA dioxygenase family protein [Planctomycetota bacterium]
MDLTSSPQPGYRYRFEAHEIDAIAECNAAHGFAIAIGVIERDLVDEMSADVRRVIDPDGGLGPAGSRYSMDVVEHAPSTWKLLEHEPFMRLQRRLTGSDDLVLHRTAAIIRNPGSPGMGWHTDMPLASHPPRTANEVLNRGEWGNSLWHYLTGSHPDRGGLAVIADSHRADWPGPQGFEFTPDRQTFHRIGATGWHLEMDVPGMVPLHTEPGDLAIFAARTYHAAFPHRGDRPRLSLGIGLRPRSERFDIPWPLPESSRRFIAALPERLQRFADGYPGIVPDWKLETAEAR